MSCIASVALEYFYVFKADGYRIMGSITAVYQVDFKDPK